MMHILHHNKRETGIFSRSLSFLLAFWLFLAWTGELHAGASFSAAKEIDDATLGAAAFRFGDLDGDGDEDLVVALADTGNVVWYASSSGGNIWSENLISATQDGPVALEVVDMDGDGELDIVVASENDGRIVWYRNGGSGTSWSAADIASVSGAAVLYVADIDGDGDRDLVSGAAGSGNL
ncbi:MAG: VCBS repeat-containing protein, partial [Planctomycetes bacterium]|nr:VCBS repeat-containing protein [Planctomycetota bacterium]